MELYNQSIGTLITQFQKLPGVGKKTAQRYAYKIIDMPQKDVMEFVKAITECKSKVHYCSICGNFTESDTCDICVKRDHSVICVVKDPKDIVAIENPLEYKGVYHVLGGVLNPMEGIGPNNLRIRELIARITDGVTEVIIATNPDVEGEATAMYIARLLKPLGVKVTRIAHGIPIGSEIEYTDKATLSRAIAERKPL